MNRIEQYQKNLFELQERAVRMENEDWTEEQIKQRCAELKNHIIDSESINNRFRNSFSIDDILHTCNNAISLACTIEG